MLLLIRVGTVIVLGILSLRAICQPARLSFLDQNDFEEDRQDGKEFSRTKPI